MVRISLSMFIDARRKAYSKAVHFGDLLTTSIFSYTFRDIRDNADLYPPITERRLVFHPNSTIFGDLVKNASKYLNIDSPYGVNDESELESAMLKRKLIAAVQFHHPAVSNHFSTLHSMPKLNFFSVCRL